MSFLGTYSSASIRGWKSDQSLSGRYSLSAVIPSNSYSYDVNSNGSKIATISYDAALLRYVARVINVETQTIEYTSTNIYVGGDISFNVEGNVVYIGSTSNLGNVYSTTFNGSAWSNAITFMSGFSTGGNRPAIFKNIGSKIRVGGNNTVFVEGLYHGAGQDLFDAIIVANTNTNVIWGSSFYLGEGTDDFDVSRGAGVTNLVIGDDGISAPGGIDADRLATIVNGYTRYYATQYSYSFDFSRNVAINSYGNVFVTCRSTQLTRDPSIDIWLLGYDYDPQTFYKAESLIVPREPSLPSLDISGVNNTIAASYSNATHLYTYGFSSSAFSVTLSQTIPQQGIVKFSDDGSTLVILSNGTLYVYKL